MIERTSTPRSASWVGIALIVAGVACTVQPAAAVPADAGLVQVAPGNAREGALDAAGLLQPVYYSSHAYRRHSRAGLYNCGRHALKTHLERQACGSFHPSRDRLNRRRF